MAKKRGPPKKTPRRSHASKPTPAPEKTKSKPKPKSSKPQPALSTQPQGCPSVAQSLQDQQRLVNVFENAFEPILTSENLPVLLQEIKQALFNRDFAAAFGREDYLEAYAARWSPTRALCYVSVFLGIRKYMDQIFDGPDGSDHGGSEDGEDASAHGSEAGGEGDVDASAEQAQDSTEDVKVSTEDGKVCTEQVEDSAEGVEDSREEPQDSTEQHVTGTSPTPRNLEMLSIGGCAAEHVAFASYLQQTTTRGTLTLLDAAPWTQVTNLLQKHITTPRALSKYASASAISANKAFLEASQMSVSFSQDDALALDTDKLAALVGAEPLVVTLLFTLNELYSEGGLGKTTKLLKALGDLLPHGSLLLVVDSPGSYSEAAVGKESKKYPMQWLLNHTLVETETQGFEWEQLESHDSTWFRCAEDLKYPINLENMRYQMHLYRKANTS